MMKCLIDAEKWAFIEGYRDTYQVSTFGRVRSMDRVESLSGRHPNPYPRYRRGRLLKQSTTNAGYKQVLLYLDGISKQHLVHRLVASAFVATKPGCIEVNHLNEVKADNHFKNLEWCDRSHNALHSSRKFRGSKSGTSKLDEEDVIQIYYYLKEGLSQTEIAKLFNVTNHTIHKIKCGKNWGWLTGLDKEDN